MLKLVEQPMLHIYSQNTICTYRQAFYQHLIDTENSLANPESDQILNYFMNQIKQQKWGESTQNTFINALAFFYRKVSRQEIDLRNLINPAYFLNLYSHEEN